MVVNLTGTGRKTGLAFPYCIYSSMVGESGVRSENIEIRVLFFFFFFFLISI
jgi:hypothetical protein